jgi:hypothetical protein
MRATGLDLGDKLANASTEPFRVHAARGKLANREQEFRGPSHTGELVLV